ncbi:MAG TPA: DUF5939 domain-containing protein [Dehalococcoidia bacterium]|nr:DUF5939 domain-containing protein [Dehalococcoidia bacterium]
MRYPEFHYRWQWRLSSTPDQLWPMVADTNRFNRDTGLPAVSPIEEGPHAGANARRRLQFRRFGLAVKWEEEAFEWTRPQRFGVNRRYLSGPVNSLRVLVQLEPQTNGGTLLTYESWLRTRTLLGATVLPILMRLNRGRFGATFRKYDAAARQGASPQQPIAKASLAPGGEERLQRLAGHLRTAAAEPEVASKLVETIRSIDDITAARLRPYQLADDWGLPRRKALEVCLHAARLGLLDLSWDVVCPLCRGAKQRVTRLVEMQGQVHCEICNIDISANFERSVEITFAVSGSIRAVKQQDFCVAGPEVTPHVTMQQLLAPAEQREISLPLEPGRYRIRTLSLPGQRLLQAAPGGDPEIAVTAAEAGWPQDEALISLIPRIQLENATGEEQLFILERTAWSDQATMAAEVLMLQTFRDLFSTELLRAGENIAVGSVTVMFTDMRDSTRLYQQIGDAPAFGRVLSHFAVLRDAVVAEEGSIVKTIGDAVMAIFSRPAAALNAALNAQEQLASAAMEELPIQVKIGIHHGPCIAVTLNERLDYFGSVVNIAARLERLSQGDDVVVSSTVRDDPEVAKLLEASYPDLEAAAFEAQLKGFDDRELLYRIRRGRE